MAAPPLDLDSELRALYRGPLAEFVAARAALAKRLKLAGDERHGEVRELRKPSLSAWGVNQLFAGEAAAMKALVAAGEQARRAQKAAAAGKDREPLRRALATIRDEVPRLAARGAALLAAGGREPGETIRERLRVDLEALALDPAAAPVAARGWLDDDLEPPGFEVLAALQVAAAAAPGGRLRLVAAPPPRAAPAAPPPPREATIHTLADAREKREREARERRERQRRERVDRLAADAGRADAEAARQRRLAAEAEKAAERAAEDVVEATRRAEEARRAAVEALARAGKADAASAAAREALQAELAAGDDLAPEAPQPR